MKDQNINLLNYHVCHAMANWVRSKMQVASSTDDKKGRMLNISGSCLHKKKLWNVISRICLRSNHHSQTGSRREQLPLKTTQQVNTHQQNTQTQTQFVSQTHNYHSKPQNRLTTNKGQQTHKGQKNTQLSRKLFLEKHCFYIKSQKVTN